MRITGKAAVHSSVSCVRSWIARAVSASAMASSARPISA